jgi:hypothetical protein
MAASRFGSDMPTSAPVGVANIQPRYEWQPGRVHPWADGARTVEACWVALLAGSSVGSIAEVVRGGRRASQTGWAP